MFGRLMPREDRFFDLFNEHAAEIVQGARELLNLMNGFDDLQRRVYNIEAIEKQADKITYATIDMLHKTFITPIDRDDIHQLITRMDDILDLHRRRGADHRRCTTSRRSRRKRSASPTVPGAAARKCRPRVALLHNMDKLAADRRDLRRDRPPGIGRRPRHARRHVASCSATSRTCAT